MSEPRNLTIQRGASFEVHLRAWAADHAPVDPTGWSAQAAIVRYGDGPPVTDFTVTIPPLSAEILTLTFELTLTAAQTRAIPHSALWGIEVTPPDSADPIPFLPPAKIQIHPEVVT